MKYTLSGHVVNVVSGTIEKGIVEVKDGKIASITPAEQVDDQYILPGLVDAHVHVESSMLIPSEFARLAVVHGTVATISDPHEIANVNGVDGVEYMIENGNKVPFHFHFGAPSCVPATAFETAGATIGPKEVQHLLERDDVHYLAEMMNYPGVLFKDPMVMEKLAIAEKLGKPIDGHAPGLTGDDALAYINSGISTDHECFTLDEALFKVQNGMKILIREGSAAKNFEALIDLIDEYPEQIMFCSDDKHPDDLIKGHINLLIKRALGKGKDFMSVLRAATLNPVQHYHMNNGLLQVGDSADMAIVNNLDEFEVLTTYVAGHKVSSEGSTLIDRIREEPINHFSCNAIQSSELALSLPEGEHLAIKVIDQQIVTDAHSFTHSGGTFEASVEDDLLKIAVVNRYNPAKPAVAVVHATGLQKGAFASTVAHDSHNIIAIGTNDDDLTSAINALVECEGGVAAVHGANQKVLPLSVSGLMSNADGYEVAKQYEVLDQFVKGELGCSLTSPFMTLSFLALLVIPKLKLSDKGLFDGEKFGFV